MREQGRGTACKLDNNPVMPIRQDKITSDINDVLFAGLTRTITAARLGTYMVAAGHDRNRALSLYVWNAAMGQAFHFPLQAVEVALRNCINPILCAEFGPDWWNETQFRSWASLERVNDIEQAKKRLTARNLPLVTDQIVATLSFGFWVGILHKRNNPRVWNKQIRVAFPTLPKSQHHDIVYQTAAIAADLRNEIFHHEPIFARNLSGDYGYLLALLKWMCPETEAWVRQYSSVPTVIRLKP